MAPKPVMRLTDSLRNLVEGIGFVKSPIQAAQYIVPYLSKEQIEQAFRSNWCARKAVLIPAQDMTRSWRSWQASKPDIEKIEAYEEELDIQRKIKRAITKARLYGGAAIILGVDDRAFPYEELVLDNLGAEALKYIHVVPKHELTITGNLIDDLSSPYFGEPEMYERRVTGAAETFRIHPSRVIRVHGVELPDWNMLGLQSKDGWGDSVLQSIDDAVKGTAIVTQGVANMVNDAKVDVFNVPNLSELVNDSDQKARIVERFNFANTMKSTSNSLLMDGAEKWQRIQTNFAGLPEVMQMFLLIVSGAADIPVTRFLGQSPAGLNATGESDIRNHYDRIKSDQENELSPDLWRLDELLIRSATGKRDDSIWYEWNSLWQMTNEQRSEIASKKAGVVRQDLDMGLVDPETLKIVRENMLIEDGFYPGLDIELDKRRSEKVAEGDVDETDPELVSATQVAVGASLTGAKGTEDVAKLAMNGAQVSSLVEIVTAVGTKAMPLETAVQLVLIAFPNVNETQARAMLEPAEQMEKPEPAIPFGGAAPIVSVKPNGDINPKEPNGDNVVPFPKKVAVAGVVKDAVIDDTAPRTLYVRRDVVNGGEILNWAKEQGFETTLPTSELHVTLIYSKTPVDWMKIGAGYPAGNSDGVLTVAPGGPRQIEEFGEGAIVLAFSALDLEWRHREMVEAGASFDYDVYTPHITITSQRGTLDLSSVEPYRGKIVLGPEVFTEITTGKLPVEEV